MREQPAGSVEFGVRVIDLNHIRAGTRRSSGGPPPCSYAPVAADWDRDHYLVDQTDIPLAARFYWIVCDDRSYLRWYVPGDADPVAGGLLTELVQEAFDRIHATPPGLSLSPGIDRYQLTGIPTWLAVDADHWDDPPSGTVTAGGVGVTAWLEPEHVDWQLGNGDAELCLGPGNTYRADVAFHEQAAECSYTYTTTPAHHTGVADATTFPLSATVSYTARYSVSGFAGLDGVAYTLGAIEGPAATADVEVREQRAVRTITR